MTTPKNPTIPHVRIFLGPGTSLNPQTNFGEGWYPVVGISSTPVQSKDNFGRTGLNQILHYAVIDENHRTWLLNSSHVSHVKWMPLKDKYMGSHVEFVREEDEA